MLYLVRYFFFIIRDGLIENYAELFTGGGEQGYSAAANFSRKWGWYQSLFSGLAQGDITRFKNITKLNIHECLYALSFMKEKSELEAKQIKSKMKK